MEYFFISTNSCVNVSFELKVIMDIANMAELLWGTREKISFISREQARVIFYGSLRGNKGSF